MDDLDANLWIAQFFQRLFDSLNRALYVRFDNQRQLFGFANFNLFKQIIKGNLLIGAEFLLFCFLTAFFNQFTSQSFILYGIELVACCRNLCQTGDLDRSGWASCINLFAFGVGHDADTSNRCAGNDAVAGVQGTVLYQNGCNRTAAFVEFCFDDGTFCHTVRICFQLLDLSYQLDVFQQVLNTHLCFCGYRNTDNVAAPFLRNQLVLGQLLFYLFWISSWFIHLVDSNNDRNACCLRMVDRLNGLRHDTVVSCYNQDSDVGDVCAASTHRGECLMSWGIQEGDRLVIDHNLICTDVLGNTAGLGGGDVGVTDCVQNGGFTVVNVTHNNNNRRTFYLLIVAVLAVVEQTILDGDNNLFFYLGADFHCNQCSGIVVDDIGNRFHLAEHHQTFDDLCGLNLQFQSQIADGDLIRQSDMQLLTALALHLQFAHLFHLFVLFGHEILFLVVSAADLLLLDAVVTFCQIFRSDIFVALIVFIQINVSCTHVDVADHLAFDVLIQLWIDCGSLTWCCRFRRLFCRLLLLTRRIAAVLTVIKSSFALRTVAAVVKLSFALWTIVKFSLALRTVAAVVKLSLALWTIVKFSLALRTVGTVVKLSLALRTIRTSRTVIEFAFRAVAAIVKLSFALWTITLGTRSLSMLLWCIVHILCLPLLDPFLLWCSWLLQNFGLLFMAGRFLQSLLLWGFRRFWCFCCRRFLFWSLWSHRHFCRRFRFWLRSFLCCLLGRFLYLLHRLGLLLVCIIAVQIIHLVLLCVCLKNQVELLIGQDGGPLFLSWKMLFQQLSDVLHLHAQILGNLTELILVVYHKKTSASFLSRMMSVFTYETGSCGS